MVAIGSILYLAGFFFAAIAGVLHIILLVKLFKNGGVGLGILGVFCAPFAYVWGWMKAGELKHKALMIWITIMFLITGALFGVGAGMFAGSPEVQKAIKDAQEQQKLNSPSY